MKTTYFKLIIAILMLASSCSPKNSHMPLIGLWSIEKVSMGDQEMTPQARWTDIREDGKYFSGNGWLRHDYGNWSYQSETNLFNPKTVNGIEDEAGPFTVSLENENQMIWQREEGGGIVNVRLKRIDELPKAPATDLIGLWKLNNEGIEEDKISSIHIRWSHIFVKRTADGGRETGYWIPNDHRPEVTFLSHTQGKPVESWRVSFESVDELKMEGLSDTNRDKTLTYSRILAFPD